MVKSYRYCINCEDEVEFTWTDGDKGDIKSKGWFCCDCNWRLDERKVRHIEERLELEHEILNRLNEIYEDQKYADKLKDEYLKKYKKEFKE